MSKKIVEKDGEIVTPMQIAGELIKLEKLKRDVDARIKTHKQALLAQMTDLDVLSLKTGAYTLSRKEYKRVNIIDDERAAEHLEEMGVPVEKKTVLDMDLMSNPIKQLLDKGEHIDGVEETKTPYVTVRMTKKELK